MPCKISMVNASIKNNKLATQMAEHYVGPKMLASEIDDQDELDQYDLEIG